MDYETLKTAYSIFKEVFLYENVFKCNASNYKTEVKN